MALYLRRLSWVLAPEKRSSSGPAPNSPSLSTSKGDVRAFGLNNNGQSGIGYINEGTFLILTPTQVSGLSVEALGGERVVRISGSEAHTLFLTSGGRVFTCGKHYIGQLGLPKDDPIFAKNPQCVPCPVQVPLPDPADHVVRIATSTRGNRVVTAAGALYGWGGG
ncbi:rcc1 domain-containing protein [Moniliophthora roreri]|uniref:Putative RCC1/BLIP-II n=1 Tax=Moniliophthora roreri TaxID=221103 RepID=A0A0W0F6W1_MONRR|nr:rcc1 domain-containing protein [Moniliophthora roreri]